MKKQVLGRGLEVSAVGLGCMGMSHANGAPMDENEAVELLHRAAGMGYTYFDTAETYGLRGHHLCLCKIRQLRIRTVSSQMSIKNSRPMATSKCMCTRYSPVKGCSRLLCWA